ncbi:MAG: DUF1972 domain-containing protein [Candidatus Symbiothrix sp.]|jgi:hypothetical protein|nr:DUF1972 domain-containing protein [Candidatus Symbiothrix sp.]
MTIAIVGIQGLPNNYGGFETLSEYLVKYLAKDIEFTVYCSSVDLSTSLSMYNGARLKYIPISSHGAKGILYDCVALIDAVKSKFDVILILGFGPGLVMPFLSKKTRARIILNFGGLDWKRDKWGRVARRIIRLSEKLLVGNSALVISDNLKIQDYVFETYHKKSELIAYGGDQVETKPLTGELVEHYPFLKTKYAFIVTRIQSDNNIEMMLNAFIQADKYPFVVVGNWNASNYGQKTKAKYSNIKPVILLDAIYDREILDVLRSNCYIYVHGHSAGGTNPSLCEAMYLELPVFAFASGYNEETTHHQALYFRDSEELKELILNINETHFQEMKKELKVVATQHYCWNVIANQYKDQFLKIVNKQI